MAALDIVGVTEAQIVAKRFRTSPARVRGSGNFAILFLCWFPMKIHLYQTASDRDAAWQRYENIACGAYNCAHDHKAVNL